MYIPNSTWTWSFTGVAIAQAAIGLALESYVFGKFQKSLRGAEQSTQARTIPTYLSLFIFGFIYQLVLIWDALRLKNTIQIIGLCCYNYGLMVYAAVQIDQIRDAIYFLGSRDEIDFQIWFDVKPYCVAVPCVLALGAIILSVIAWKLYDEFAWTIYKHISADVRMKKRYLAFQIYIALLKFDFFFFLSFTVQFLVVVTYTTTVELALTIAAVPLTIILLIMAGYWTRHESFPGMIFSIFMYFAAMAYFLFKLVRMYDANDPDRVADYAPAVKGLTLFAVSTLILLVLTVINAFWCMNNFGKGLKPYITNRKVLAPEDKAQAYEGDTAYNGNLPLGHVQTRMTID